MKSIAAGPLSTCMKMEPFVLLAFSHWFQSIIRVKIQNYGGDPRPPHTRQKYEQKSGQNMTPNASKQGKFQSGSHIFAAFFALYVGVGVSKGTPTNFDISPLKRSVFRVSERTNRVRKKGVFWKRGLFRRVHFLEILENLEILEILENPRLWKEWRIRPVSRDSRESRDVRDFRDSSSEKTSFVMTPFSSPEQMVDMGSKSSNSKQSKITIGLIARMASNNKLDQKGLYYIIIK